MPYIGHEPTNAGNFYILDDFNGLGQDGSSNTYDQNANGTIVNFKLKVAGVEITPNIDNLFVTIDGVVQHPTDAYTISGSILTFDEGPASGVDFHCFIMGQSASVGEGSIGADELKVSGDGTNNQLLKSDGDGTMSWINQNTVTASTANVATHVTVADNESTNENNLLTFVEDASGAGNVGLESDGDLHYNPSTGRLTATQLAGTLQTAAQTNITSLGTLTGLTIENATNPLVVGSGTKDLYFDPDSNGVMVSTATSQGGDGHYYNDSSGEVWTTIDGTAKVKVKASAFEVTPDATFSGNLIINGSSSRQIEFKDGSTSEGAIVFDEITNGLVFKVGGTSGSSKLDALKITSGGEFTMTSGSDMILNLVSTATNGKEYEIQSTDAGNLTFVRRTGSAAEILRFTGSDDSATFAGDIKTTNHEVVHETGFGYDASTYKVIQFGGDKGGNKTISLGYDPSGNSNGSFAGSGDEILTRNTVTWKTPNDANNGWHTPLAWNDGDLTTYGDLTISGTNNPSLFITSSEAGTDNFRIYVGGTGLSFYNTTDSKAFHFKHDGDLSFGHDGASVNTKTWGNAEVTGNLDAYTIKLGGDWLFEEVSSTTVRIAEGFSTLQLLGAMSKGSGSFQIDHPLPSKKDTHYLVHSFTESPRADLIYRDKVTLVDGSATVNIDTVAGMTEGTFVLLCDDVQCFTSNESDWKAVKGSVSGNILTIECEDSNSTADVAWMVIGDRKDKHILETPWTDENGKPIIEPEKESA